MLKYGLIGRNISYSFSRNYFRNKFRDEGIINATYSNFDIQTIEEFETKVKTAPEVKGFNVTIPYKESIIPYLDKLDKKAKNIGAVNTIRITKKGKLVGYNTDCYGFKKALKPHLKKRHKKALVLGTGGASKAIIYTLKQLNIDFSIVSRKASRTVDYTYESLSETDIESHQIIINCTPLGTHPNIQDCPKIPYQAISKKHILFDLIYNPEQTRFLQLGAINNATTINGLKMLEFQAEKAWLIWNT